MRKRPYALISRLDGSLEPRQNLGATEIDYHVASHYHDDHIGCTTQVLTQCPLLNEGLTVAGRTIRIPATSV